MSLVPRHFSKGYARAATDQPVQIPIVDTVKKATAWAKAHPSPFRRKPKNKSWTTSRRIGKPNS